MGETAKIAQSAPGATTATTLYTVPFGTKFVGKIEFCERGGAAATYRVAIIPTGEVLANQHYIRYGDTLSANTAGCIEGLVLDQDTSISIYASTADTSFTLMGIEIDNG